MLYILFLISSLWGIEHEIEKTSSPAIEFDEINLLNVTDTSIDYSMSNELILFDGLSSKSILWPFNALGLRQQHIDIENRRMLVGVSSGDGIEYRVFDYNSHEFITDPFDFPIDYYNVKLKSDTIYNIVQEQGILKCVISDLNFNFNAEKILELPSTNIQFNQSGTMIYQYQDSTVYLYDFESEIKSVYLDRDYKNYLIGDKYIACYDILSNPVIDIYEISTGNKRSISLPSLLSQSLSMSEGKLLAISANKELVLLDINKGSYTTHRLSTQVHLVGSILGTSEQAITYRKGIVYFKDHIRSIVKYDVTKEQESISPIVYYFSILNGTFTGDDLFTTHKIQSGGFALSVSNPEKPIFEIDRPYTYYYNNKLFFSQEQAIYSYDLASQSTSLYESGFNRLKGRGKYLSLLTNGLVTVRNMETMVDIEFKINGEIQNVWYSENTKSLFFTQGSKIYSMSSIDGTTLTVGIVPDQVKDIDFESAPNIIAFNETRGSFYTMSSIRPKRILEFSAPNWNMPKWSDFELLSKEEEVLSVEYMKGNLIILTDHYIYNVELNSESYEAIPLTLENRLIYSISLQVISDSELIINNGHNIRYIKFKDEVLKVDDIDNSVTESKIFDYFWVYDLTGKEVSKGDFLDYNILINELENGKYFILKEYKGQFMSEKIFKE